MKIVKIIKSENGTINNINTHSKSSITEDQIVKFLNITDTIKQVTSLSELSYSDINSIIEYVKNENECLTEEICHMNEWLDTEE